MRTYAPFFSIILFSDNAENARYSVGRLTLRYCASRDIFDGSFTTPLFSGSESRYSASVFSPSPAVNDAIFLFKNLILSDKNTI